MRNVITMSLVVRRRTIKVRVHYTADGIKTTSGIVMTKKNTKRNETKRNETKTEDKTRILREGLFFFPKNEDSSIPRKMIPIPP